MKKRIRELFQESIDVKQKALEKNAEVMVKAVKLITKTLKAGKKIILFGNGGSAADSQHMAGEFIGRFQKERRSLPAVALTTDTSILTALGNDYSYDVVFSRQLEGLGQKGDIAFGISTSGNSKNVLEALKTAQKKGMATVSLTGNDGGKIARLTDLSMIVPSKVTARVQESHICIIHALCELVENQFD